MSKPVYTADKPSDCHYCYFWTNGRKGCRLGRNNLSPIAPNKQTYRGAQLWFNIDDSGKGLVPDRQNTEWQAVRKGSLQHEIFIGENPIVWNDDDLIIKVNCKEEANKIKTAIPYCLFVSFEVAEGFDVNLYADVSAKIHQRVQISNN